MTVNVTWIMTVQNGVNLDFLLVVLLRGAPGCRHYWRLQAMVYIVHVEHLPPRNKPYIESSDNAIGQWSYGAWARYDSVAPP